jgi:lactate dehydrogenase-like 2-hydroxyacid dehydrogenase
VALTPEGTTIPVAEHVFLLILSLYRNLLPAATALREGRWLQWSLRSRSFNLVGKRLGIVGLGRIGREVARRGRAFGCQIIYTDLARAPAEVEAELEATYASLDDLLAQADIVTLHVPLTEATRGLIGARELARMRPSAILINTARGGLVDEEALYRALVTGQIAGAGLDVFAQEPPPPDTPSCAWRTWWPRPTSPRARAMPCGRRWQPPSPTCSGWPRAWSRSTGWPEPDGKEVIHARTRRVADRDRCTAGARGAPGALSGLGHGPHL